MMRKAPSRGRGQRGQSAIETALMMVLIITVIFTIFEICELMYTYSVIADAANEGVRYAIVHSGGDVSGTRNQVLKFAKLSMHDVSAMTTTVSFPDGAATPPSRVRVTVSYSYIPYIHSFMRNPPSMNAYSEGRMVVQ